MKGSITRKLKAERIRLERLQKRAQRGLLRSREADFESNLLINEVHEHKGAAFLRALKGEFRRAK